MTSPNLTHNQIVWAIVTPDGIPTQTKFSQYTSASSSKPGQAVLVSTRTGSVYTVAPDAVLLRPPVQAGQTVYAVVTSDGIPTTGKVMEITETGIKMQSFKSGKTYDVADAAIFFTWANAQEMYKKNNAPREIQADGFKVVYDRDWTWVFFPGKPGEITRTNLKHLGFSWSGKRGGWYAEKHVEILDLTNAVTATVVVAQTSAQVLLENEVYRVTKERDWTWVQLLDPANKREVFCKALANLGARRSFRRDGAWYFKQAVELDALKAALV
ncbi:MAG: hypothetical protein KJ077_10965 [Anaerolineae bacterium]|nr:hypothetical protein [Anaerolineae bacterium]